MKPVIIIAVAFVLLIPVYAFADDFEDNSIGLSGMFVHANLMS